ncbi:MAG: helix-turn-helix domain-containing protein [Chroococcidiopsidaceae cyanobacterium CP_BM_RX_35]|nr:helix-turn-helix domain-containing protein [Chroococcidiopsidaceae cyanobacterium CP_BM_RX_35]
MGKIFKLNITQTSAELKTLLRKQTTSRGKERIQALYLLKIGKVKTLKDLAEVLGRDIATLYRWFQKYKLQGLNGLLEVKGGQGKKPVIPQEVMEQLKQRLEDTGEFRTYQEIRTWLKEMYGVEASYKVVHEAVRYKLKIKLEVSRANSDAEAKKN